MNLWSGAWLRSNLVLCISTCLESLLRGPALYHGMGSRSPDRTGEGRPEEGGVCGRRGPGSAQGGGGEMVVV